MRAAIYARVSKAHLPGRSVEEQLAECTAEVARNGWDLVATFVDEDKGASRYSKGKRGAYANIAGFVEGGGCDVLVAWEASRFQRDLTDYVTLARLCETHGVLWSYTGRTYDLSRTDDRFQTGLDALLAERESSQTRDRILRTVRANAEKRRPHGRIRYGYRRNYDPNTGALVDQVIDEAQAEIIREAARRIVAGEVPNAIARDLNARGVPTPAGGGWDLTRVRRMVTAPTVAGLRVFRGEVIGPATWPAILDELTWRRCVSYFADPTRRTTDDHRVRYLLSGLAHCGVCGGRIKVGPQRSGYKTYLCVKFCVARKVEWVDGAIEGLIVARMSQPDASAMFGDEDHDSAPILDAITAHRVRLEEWYDAAARGELSPAGLARIESGILADIKTLEAQVRRHDVPQVMYDLVANPEKVWANWSIEQKRTAVAFLLDVTILPTRRGVRRFDPASVAVRWRRDLAGPPTARR